MKGLYCEKRARFVKSGIACRDYVPSCSLNLQRKLSGPSRCLFCVFSEIRDGDLSPWSLVGALRGFEALELGPWSGFFKV